MEVGNKHPVTKNSKANETKRMIIRLTTRDLGGKYVEETLISDSGQQWEEGVYKRLWKVKVTYFDLSFPYPPTRLSA